MAYEKGNGKTAVIALGGNALGNTPQEQLELVQNTAKHIVDMIQDGTNVVVSHGNGPQVGMINNAFAYAAANLAEERSLSMTAGTPSYRPSFSNTGTPPPPVDTTM